MRIVFVGYFCAILWLLPSLHVNAQVANSLNWTGLDGRVSSDQVISSNIETYKQKLAENDLSLREKSGLHGALGLAYAASGQRLLARESLSESVALAERIGALDLASRSQFNLALVELSEIGREVVPTNWFAVTRSGGSKREVYGLEPDASENVTLDSVIAQLELAAQNAERAGDQPLQARALATAAKYQLARESADEASKLLTAAHEALDPSDLDRQQIEASLLVGEVGILLLSTESAGEETEILEQSFNRLSAALLSSRSTGEQRLEAYAHGLLSRLYGLEKRTVEAIRLSERAIELAEASDSRESLFVWHGQLASLYEQSGDIDGALEEYRRATRSIQNIRSDLAQSVAGAGQVSSRELIEPILLSYVELLLQSGTKDDLIAARAVVEQLKTIEFERFFEESCVADATGTETSIATVAENVAVLYTVLFDDSVELIISTNARDPDTGQLVENIEKKSVPVDRGTLEFTVRSARNQIRFDDGSKGPLTDLTQLYDWLVRPIEPILEAASVDTIVFAPDGALRGLPLAALYNSKSGSFVIENYAVASTLGLSLIDPTPFDQTTKLGIVAGVSDPLTIQSDTNEAGRSFVGLDAVPVEIRAVSEFLPGPVLLNDRFTPQALAQTMSQTRFSVAHLATHATFGRTAADSYLLAYGADGANGSKITLDDLEAFSTQARIRGEPIELLTLSACETGVGDPTAESETAILGLAGVAFKAGARSVLASLWQVYDDSTRDLMIEFYGSLIPEQSSDAMSKAQALRQAQLSLLARDETDHPAHWAAFILYGNWL